MGRLWTRLRAWSWKRWTVVGLVLFVVGSIGSVELTSQAWFCNSCHIMNPYYASWKVGSHKDIQCVACHIAPGVDNFVAAKLNGLGQVVDDVLSRTSNKPSASVSQLSCTRSGCHSVETLNAKSIDNGKFKFRHDKHLNAKHLGVEISCGTCHAHVKGDQHFEVNTSVCITCHLTERVEPTTPGPANQGLILMGVRVGHSQFTPEGKPDAAKAGGEATEPAAPADAPAATEKAPDAAPAPAHQPAAPAVHAAEPGGHDDEKTPPANCLSCHQPPAGQFEYRGMKVDHTVFLSYGATCESCHRGVTATPPPMDDGRCLQCHTFGVERALEPKEMHRVHTLGRHKIECLSCHGSVRHGPEVQAASVEVFDCTKCHTDQHSIQRNTYFHVVAPEAGVGPVSPMFLAHVDCTGCHIKARRLDSKPDSGATVFTAAPEACDACHKPGYGNQIIPLWQRNTRTMHDQAEKDLAKTRDLPGVDPAAIREAEELIRLVREDGSWGVHNPRYAQGLLEQARARLAAARAAATGSTK